MTTLLERIPPKLLRAWDHEDYKVFSPVSLDDNALVTVVLRNKDGSSFGIVLGVDGIRIINHHHGNGRFTDVTADYAPKERGKP